MSNLINCGTCGYPLAPEERTTLVEKDGVMVKPAREWVGLTDKDTTKTIDKMPNGINGYMREWDLYEFTRAIEAKLREKNA